MENKKQQEMGLLTKIFSALPWWLCLMLALSAYAVLHGLSQGSAETDPAGQNGQTLIFWGQILLPALFVLFALTETGIHFARGKGKIELILCSLTLIFFFGLVIYRDGGVGHFIEVRFFKGIEKKVSEEPIKTVAEIEADKQALARAQELERLQGISRRIDERQSRGHQDVHVLNPKTIQRLFVGVSLQDGNNLVSIDSIISHARETAYLPYGSAIIIPVIVGNKGKAYSVNMVFDTGCSTTLLDEEVAKELNLGATKGRKATLADGRVVTSQEGKVDFFHVGPFQEMEFTITSYPVEGKDKITHGLLGMNFLERHPFTIDHKRKVIVWR